MVVSIQTREMEWFNFMTNLAWKKMLTEALINLERLKKKKDMKTPLYQHIENCTHKTKPENGKCII